MVVRRFYRMMSMSTRLSSPRLPPPPTPPPTLQGMDELDRLAIAYAHDDVVDEEMILTQLYGKRTKKNNLPTPTSTPTLKPIRPDLRRSPPS